MQWMYEMCHILHKHNACHVVFTWYYKRVTTAYVEKLSNGSAQMYKAVTSVDTYMLNLLSLTQNTYKFEYHTRT